MPCSLLSLDVMDVSGEEQLDVSHDVFKRRLEADGRPHVEEAAKSHVGHDPSPVVHPVEHDNGTLIDPLRNVTYCGSCYGAQEEEGQCCNDCGTVRELYRRRGWAFNTQGEVEQCKREELVMSLAAQQAASEGCQLYGHLRVNKVPGNWHIAPGKSFQMGAVHVHDLNVFGPSAFFNMSHVINKLSFGVEYPGQVNPLDGATVSQGPSHLMYQYFVKVVPTQYTDRRRRVLKTAQFSVTEHPKCVPGGGGRGEACFVPRALHSNPTPSMPATDTYHLLVLGARSVDILTGRNLPGVFCFYEINPIQVRLAEKRTSLLHFLTNVCAIVGGVFTVSGLVDSTVYHGQRVLLRKHEMGKLG